MELRNRRIPSMQSDRNGAEEAVPADASPPAAADAPQSSIKEQGSSSASAPSAAMLLLVVAAAAAAFAGAHHMQLLPAPLEQLVVQPLQQQLLPRLQSLKAAVAAASGGGSGSRSSRVYSAEELAVFTGGRLPGHVAQIYVAILGEVFDVTAKPEFYAPGNGYAHFAGTDGSKSFITGDFAGDVTDDVSSLDEEACLGLVGWLDFYHKTYPHVGKLAGAFYDASGAATAALASVHARAEAGRQLQAAREAEEAAWPSCSSRWTEAEGGEVWCDDGMYPRKLFVSMQNGQATWRCACFSELGWSDVRQVYAECAPDAHRCSTAASEREEEQQGGGGNPEAAILSGFGGGEAE